MLCRQSVCGAAYTREHGRMRICVQSSSLTPGVLHSVAISIHAVDMVTVAGSNQDTNSHQNGAQ